jgi:periplasmic protein TonB
MELVIDNKEHRKKALLISAAFYAVILTAMFFFKIMYEPTEEPIAMGVDLNYGLDLTGYGDIQTLNKANDSKNDYDVAPADAATETKAASKPQPSTPTPSPKTPSPKTKSQSAPPVITSDAEKSPVVMKKTATQSSSQPKSSTGPTSPPAPTTPTRSVDNGSVMKKSGSSSNSNGTVGTRDGIGGNNNGDGKPGDVGDQGDPRGTPDGKSLYGNPGSGGAGSSISGLSGWNKKALNPPKDSSAETGRIIFSVTVDDRGDVIAIQMKSSTVSPSVTNYYKSYIQRSLSRSLTPQGTPPSRSTGTITINITN